MCLGISPWGTASGSSCSFRVWKSTHLHLSGMMKYGSSGHLGRPACSLHREDSHQSCPEKPEPKEPLPGVSHREGMGGVASSKSRASAGRERP